MLILCMISTIITNNIKSPVNLYFIDSREADVSQAC